MAKKAENGSALAAGRTGILFVLPAMVLFFLFVLGPLLSSVYYAFTQWNGFSAPEWVGLANFRRAWADTVHLSAYLHVSLYILGTFVFEVGFGLVMAVLLNSDRRMFSVMRGMFFAPVVLSMTAAGVLWTFVLDYRSGLLNSALRGIGLDAAAQPWLSQPTTALIAIMIVSGWKFSGLFMVIFFAALRRIPRNIYEVATIDGVGPLQQFFGITLPLLRQNIIVCVLLAVTGGFAGFDLFFVMTNGGPFGATEVPATWIVKQAFDQNQLGYGTAMTVILAVVVVLVSIVYMQVTERGRVTQY